MGDASTAARPGLDPDEVAVIAFDVFGTVVDWHGGIAAEAERALPGIDGGAFAQVFLYPNSVSQFRRKRRVKRLPVAPARAWVAPASTRRRGSALASGSA